jgi:hypothetical protein
VRTSAFVLVDEILPIGNHTISEYLPFRGVPYAGHVKAVRRYRTELSSPSS